MSNRLDRARTPASGDSASALRDVGYIDIDETPPGPPLFYAVVETYLALVSRQSPCQPG